MTPAPVCVLQVMTTLYSVVLLQAGSARWGRSLCPKYHWSPVERGRDAEAEGGGKKEERKKRESCQKNIPVSLRLQKLPFPRILSDCDEKFSER